MKQASQVFALCRILHHFLEVFVETLIGNQLQIKAVIFHGIHQVGHVQPVIVVGMQHHDIGRRFGKHMHGAGHAVNGRHLGRGNQSAQREHAQNLVAAQGIDERVAAEIDLEFPVGLASHEVTHTHDLPVHTFGYRLKHHPLGKKLAHYVLVVNLLSDIQSGFVQNTGICRVFRTHAAHTDRGNVDQPGVVAAAEVHQVGNSFHVDFFQFVPCGVMLDNRRTIVNSPDPHAFQGFQRPGIGYVPVNRNDATTEKLFVRI